MKEIELKLNLVELFSFYFMCVAANVSELFCMAHIQKNVLLNQQKFGWPNKIFRLNMGQWKFYLN